VSNPPKSRLRGLAIWFGGSIALLALLLAIAPGLRAALPETPLGIRTSGFGQQVLVPTVAAIADNPICGDEDIVPGLRQMDRIDARLDHLMNHSKPLRKDEQERYLWETPDGRFWVPYKRDFWSLAVVLAEQHERIYGEPDRDGVRPGDVVIDAGAHLGLFTHTALAQGASQVVAMEINPKSLDCMQRNLAGPLRREEVVLLDKGVWDEPAVLRAGDLHAIDVDLAEEELCSACIAVDAGAPDERSIDVQLTTIDAVVERLGLERVDFIKLDIENAEARALRGATETLRRFRPRLAVAVENAADIPAYAREIEAIVQAAVPAYRFRCGASRYRRGENRIAPEILHFSVADAAGLPPSS